MSLSLSQQIDYKFLLLTFKPLIRDAPIYPQELLQLSAQSTSLQSNNQRLPVCPQSKSARYGNSGFRVVASTLPQHKLPLHVRHSETVDHFNSNLKTHLFKAAYVYLFTCMYTHYILFYFSVYCLCQLIIILSSQLV